MVAVGVGLAFVVSWGACAAAALFGPRLGFVDVPDDPQLKVHRRPAVPLGGVAILVGSLVGWVWADSAAWNVATVAVLVVLLGLVDDKVGLAPTVRLAGEIGLVGLFVATEATVPGDASVWSLILGFVLIVASINAVNLFDGLETLAGGSALVGFVALASLAGLRGLDPGFMVVAAGATAGFLLLNRPPARVFLGDNGAYLIGLLLAVGAMRASNPQEPLELLVAALALGVFFIDLAVTVLRRRLAGAPMFSGDRSHLYDRLHARGWSISVVSGAAVAAQVVLAGAALGLDATGPAPPAVAAAGVALLGLVVALAVWNRMSAPSS